MKYKLPTESIDHIVQINQHTLHEKHFNFKFRKKWNYFFERHCEKDMLSQSIYACPHSRSYVQSKIIIPTRNLILHKKYTLYCSIYFKKWYIINNFFKSWFTPCIQVHPDLNVHRRFSYCIFLWYNYLLNLANTRNKVDKIKWFFLQIVVPP